jgi:hypothetical protein
LTSTVTKKGIESFSLTENGGDEDENGNEITENSKVWTSYKLTPENTFAVEEKEEK